MSRLWNVFENKILRAIVVLAVLYLGLIVAGCSGTKSDAKILNPMLKAVLDATKKATDKGEIAKMQWLLGPVKNTLLIEKLIIHDGGMNKLPPDIRIKLKKKDFIHIEDYNRTLKETLSSDDFDWLLQLRKKYGYSEYFESSTQK